MAHFKEYSDEQGPLFAELIRFNHCENVVEIGVAEGTTTVYLCKYAKIVHCFDLWDKHGLQNQFPALSTMENVDRYLKSKGCNNYILNKVNTKTQEFKDIITKIGKIDFAFIDGCHSYDGLKNDFDIVYPLMSDDGIIAFHDVAAIDGCREFLIDLKTVYYDGKFDIIDLPYGNGKRRCGISILKKRHMFDKKIDEICGSQSKPEEIYEKELKYYNGE